MMSAEAQLRALAAEKILIFDGGYGTSVSYTHLTLPTIYSV